MADRSVGAGHCLSAGAGGDHLLHGGPGVVDYPISGGPPSSHLLRHHYSDVDMYAGGVYPSYINSSYPSEKIHNGSISGGISVGGGGYYSELDAGAAAHHHHHLGGSSGSSFSTSSGTHQPLSVPLMDTAGGITSEISPSFHQSNRVNSSPPLDFCSGRPPAYLANEDPYHQTTAAKVSSRQTGTRSNNGGSGGHLVTTTPFAAPETNKQPSQPDGTISGAGAGPSGKTVSGGSLGGRQVDGNRSDYSRSPSAGEGSGSGSSRSSSPDGTTGVDGDVVTADGVGAGR